MIVSDRSRIVAALGIVEILAWGSSFYLIAVLSGPIAAAEGWSPGIVTAGFSVALLCSGLATPRFGDLIQRTGGRRVMASGMGLIALGLCILGAATSPAVYLLAWAVIGIGMGAGLYDAAFSTLGRIYGRGARGPITALTLWGGFASTVCWPLSAFLVEQVGWRGTCFVYAAMHLCITMPICLFGLPKAPPPVEPAGEDEPRRLRPPLKDHRFWCLAVAGTAIAVMASIWSVHLVTVLTAQGHTLAAAVALGALIGPAQVGARVIEMMGGGRHHPVWTMAVSVVLVALGFLGLRLGIPASAALVAYGAGNGLWSIARGALPLALFGPQDYPRIMGRLATPMLIASAAAPLAGTALIERVGPQGTLEVLSMIAIIPVLVTIVLVLTVRADTRLATPGR